MVQVVENMIVTTIIQKIWKIDHIVEWNYNFL